VVKNNSVLKIASSLVLLLSLAACSNSKITETESKMSLTAELITAEITQSGLAQPIINGGQAVGYKYKRTLAVPAQKGHYFGFEYSVKPIDEVAGKQQRHLPVTIQVTHPEMLVNGKKTTVTSWQDMMYFGRSNYTMWQFESDAELLNGQWNISVLLQNEVVVEKSFFVMVPPPRPAKVTEVCVAEVDKFPKPLQDAHTACCSNNDSDACYTFAWRGLEPLRDKSGALLYFAKSCEMGNISGCSTAAKITTSENQKTVYLNKACDLKDIMSCIDVGRMP